MIKRALICGVSAQDRAYLARSLLSNDYEVYRTSRDAHISPFQNLVNLGIRTDVSL